MMAENNILHSLPYFTEQHVSVLQNFVIISYFPEIPFKIFFHSTFFPVLKAIAQKPHQKFVFSPNIEWNRIPWQWILVATSLACLLFAYDKE